MQRRTFLQGSVATAAALSMGACSSNNSTSSDAVDVGAMHSVKVHYKVHVHSKEDILETLSTKEMLKAQAYLDGVTESSSTPKSLPDTYFFHSASSEQMQKTTIRAAGDDIDLHVVTTEFSSTKATVFYITHALDTPADDGRTYGLTCLYLYIPDVSANAGGNNALDTNSTADSNSSDTTQSVVEIIIDDPVSETIKAMLFMHPSLGKLRADDAKKILSHIDLSSLYNIWKPRFLLSDAMSDDSWYNATKLQNTETQEDFTFSGGINQGKAIYQFLPIDTIADSLADPLQDLMKKNCE